MRVAIAGAGAVGRSLAQALLAVGHKVLLIERHRPNYRPELVPDADWMLADACELGELRAAGIDTCNVVMAATGDDKSNLVFALLAKTEFAVPRVVARVNDPANQWLFSSFWGVDVAVSTPSSLVSAVEAAVTVGDVVRLMTLHQGQGTIVGMVLPPNSPLAGEAVAELALPSGAALLAIFRGATVLAPTADFTLRAGDELLLAAAIGVEGEVRRLLHG
jgi:trk/ktr system potassium uptake protein